MTVDKDGREINEKRKYVKGENERKEKQKRNERKNTQIGEGRD